MAVNSQNGNTLLTTGFFPPVRVASTGAPLNPSAGGLLTVDGITLNAGDRVLCKDEVSAVNNGIYAVSSGPWQRTSDATSNAQFFNGMAVLVGLGAVNAGQIYICTCPDDPVVVGTSLLTFALQSAVVNGQQQATSSTSLSVSVASKTLTIQSGKTFQAGQAVLIYETATPTNCMYGTVTSYSGSSLVVSVTAVNGSGTHSDWSVVLYPSAAAAGIAPPLGSGNVTGAGSSTTGHLATFADGTGKVLADGGTAGALANLSAVATAQLANSALAFGAGMINGTLVESHGSNAVTFAIKTLAGADPSAGDPVYVIFRDATGGLPALGSFAIITLTAATSFTFSSGSSAGTLNNVPFRIWLVGINDGGTFRLGAINCSTATQIFPLNEGVLVTTVAEGGAGGATAAGTIYTNATASSKALRILGYAEYAGLSVAGHWTASPIAIQLFGPGINKPGTVVQAVSNTGATSLAIAPTSAANLVKFSPFMNYAQSATGITLSFKRASTTLLTVFLGGSTVTGNWAASPILLDAPGVTASTTYSVANVNGSLEAESILLEEIMG
jgi:hypothetical protein